MAQGLQQAFGRGEQAWQVPALRYDELLYAVREPFASKTSQLDLIAGRLHSQDQLVIDSLMPEQGVIFSDGIEQDFLHFNSGATATLGLAPERVQLVQALTIDN